HSGLRAFVLVLLVIGPLLLPLGYWLAPLALLLAAGLGWSQRPASIKGMWPQWWAMAALLSFGAVELATGLWHREVALAWPTAAAALLAAAMVPAATLLRPQLAWWWGGLALGGVGNGLWALWQVGVAGASRANGHGEVNAILFGNLALLTGLLCLAGLGWAWQQRWRRRWLVVLLLGATGGLLASALSGTRGGWLALPLATLVFYRAYLRGWPARWRWLTLGAVALLLVGLYLTPQSGVQQRVGVAMDEATDYLAGEPNGSVGTRLEMYRGALLLIAHTPWTGRGHGGYRDAMGELMAQGRVVPGMDRYWHGHNDLLDAWVRRGFPALLILLGLYLLPLWVFTPRLVATDPETRSLAVAGLLLPVTFIDFGLSYAFFAYPIGIVVYGGWLAVVLACAASKAE
ncbi:MAG: O-antigen ligase family protein, partial [Pseudomonadota bacterium]